MAANWKQQFRTTAGRRSGNEVTRRRAIARPDDIRFTTALPKTRSGKIMRRLLKEICAGGEVKGDTTTLEDFSVIAALALSGKDGD